jgi:CheY-like chemotaxis protein
MEMGQKIILLVENNPADELQFIKTLRENKIKSEVVVVHDGVEALEYLLGMNAYKNRDLSVMPRVILLDLTLPRISGPEAMRAIRLHERTKSLPVVILTSSEKEQDMINSYKLRANNFIQKPIDFNQFIKAVQPLGLD